MGGWDGGRVLKMVCSEGWCVVSFFGWEFGGAKRYLYHFIHFTYYVYKVY